MVFPRNCFGFKHITAGCTFLYLFTRCFAGSLLYCFPFAGDMVFLRNCFGIKYITAGCTFLHLFARCFTGSFFGYNPFTGGMLFLRNCFGIEYITASCTFLHLFARCLTGSFLGYNPFTGGVFFFINGFFHCFAAGRAGFNAFALFLTSGFLYGFPFAPFMTRRNNCSFANRLTAFRTNGIFHAIHCTACRNSKCLGCMLVLCCRFFGRGFFNRGSFCCRFFCRWLFNWRSFCCRFFGCRLVNRGFFCTVTCTKSEFYAICICICFCGAIFGYRTNICVHAIKTVKKALTYSCCTYRNMKIFQFAAEAKCDLTYIGYIIRKYYTC